MKFSRFIPVVALVGSLTFSTALTNYAYAQKGTLMAPSTSWAVNRIAGQGGADDYCALARRYNQNTILTLAQNSTDEVSLALDFQRSRFKAAQNVEVVLDPGAGEQRNFDVKSVSDKAFVVRLGRDSDFMSALRKTGYLRAEVDGYAYAFDLSDIDEGQQDLAQCVTDLHPGTPESIRSAATSKSAGTAEIETKLAVLREENSSLSTRKDRLLQENQNLESKIADTKREYEDKISALEAALAAEEGRNAALDRSLETVSVQEKSALETLRNDIQEANKVIARMEGEQEVLKTQMAAEKERAEEANIRMVKLEAERDELGKQLAAISDKRESLNVQAGADLARLEQEKAEAEKKYQTMVEETNLVNTSQYQELERVRAELEKAQNEKDKVTFELAEFKKAHETEIAALEGEFSTLEKKNTTLIQDIEKERGAESQEVTSLQQDLAAKIEKNESLLKETEALKASSSSKLAELEAAQEKAKTLQAELDETRGKLAALEEKRQENATKTETEMNRLSEEKAAADKKYEALLAETEGKQTARYQELLEAQTDLKTALADKEKAEQDLTDLKKARETEVAALEREFAKLEEKNTTLIKDLEKQRGTESEEIASLRKDLAAQKEKNEALLTEIESVKTASSEKIAGFETALAENKKAEEGMAELEKAHETEVAALEQEFAKLEEKNTTLIKDLEKQRGTESEEIASLRQDLTAKSEKNEALLEEIERLKAERGEKLAGLEEQSEAQAEEKKALISELEATQAKVADLEKELEATRSQVSESTENEKEAKKYLAEIESLKGQLTAQAQETDELKRLLEGKSENGEALKLAESKNKNLKTEMEALRSELTSEIEALEAKIEAKDAAYAQLNADKSELVAGVEEKEAVDQAFSAQKQEFELVDAERKALKEQVALLQQELASQEKAYAELDGKVKGQKSQDVDAEKIQVEQKLAEVEKQNTALKEALAIFKAKLDKARVEMDAMAVAPVKTVALSDENEGEIFASTSSVDMNPAGASSVRSEMQASTETSTKNEIEVTASDTQEMKVEPVRTAEIEAEPTKKDPVRSILDKVMSPRLRKTEPAAGEEGETDTLAAPSFAPTRNDVEVAYTSDAHEAQRLEAEMMAKRQAPEPVKVQAAPQPIENKVDDVAERQINTVIEHAASEPTSGSQDLDIVVSSDEMEETQPIQQASVEQNMKLDVPDSPDTQDMAESIALNTQKYEPSYPFLSMLSRANVADPAAVSLVASQSGQEKLVYQWQNDGVYGSSELHPLNNMAQFERMVQKYLERTESRCNGDFAIVPDNTYEDGATRVDTYELACVSNNVSSSASLAFFNKDGTFTVVAHEAPVDKMERAMNARDMVVKAVRGS